jgi:phage-related protein
VAEDFKIGEGYVEISSKVDEKGIKKDADKAGETFEETFSETVDDRLKKSDGKALKETDKAGDKAGKKSGLSFSKRFTGSLLTNFKTKLLPVLGTLGAGLGAALNAGLVAGPMLAKAGPWLWNIVSAAGAAAPALAALAVSGGFVMATLKAIGPAIGKSLTPMAQAWKSASREAGRYASQGLRPLAQAFVKANFPMVRRTMDQIASSTNKVVKSVLWWTSTAKGQQAITNILGATGAAVERLAPHVAILAQSFLKMLGRIAGVSLAAGERGLSGILDKLSGLMDRVTADSVQGGLDRLKTTFQQVAHAVQVSVQFVQSAIRFYQQYEAQIKLVADAFGILAIVVGGPVTAIIAAIGLVVRHFDLIKAAWARVIAYFHTADGSAVLDNLKAAWARVWPALQKGFQSIVSAVVPALRRLWTTIKKELIPALASFIRAAAPVVAWFVGKMAPQIGKALSNIIGVVRGFARIVAGVLQVLTGILTLNWRTAWSGIKKIISGAISAIISLLGGTPSKVRAKLSKVKGAVAGAFSGAGSWLAQAGRRIISGLIGGLKSAFGDVKNTLGNLTNMIPSWKGPKKKDKKLLYTVGRTILGGLIAGFQAEAPAVAAYLRKFTDRIDGKKVSKKVKNALQAIATSGNNALKALNKQFSKVDSKLTAAKDKYKELVAAAKEYAATLKATAMGDLMSFASQDPAVPTTGASIVAGLQGQLASSKSFLENIEKLKALGLNGDYLKQILDNQNNGGADIASALLSDPTLIATVNDLQKKLSTVGTAIGKFGSDTFNKAGIQAAAGLVAGLQSQEAALVKAIEKLAAKIIKAFKKKLKIKSPSEAVASEVGEQLPAGAVVGVHRAMPKAERKIAGLAPRLGQAMSARATAGAGPVRAGVTIGNLNINIKGVLDMTDKIAARKFSKDVYEMIKGYERSYA